MKNESYFTKFKKKMNTPSMAGKIFTLPFLLGFIVFLIIPMILSLFYSFTEYNILSDPQWTGLDNYIRIFTEDQRFRKSIAVTFYYTFISVPITLVFALIIAIILNKPTKMTSFYRAAYYLPSIIGGSVAVSILWKRMFATDGVVNSFLGALGYESNFSWLGNPDTAIWTLIILRVWQFGSSMVIFLASLKQIPAELYEAAEVDGCNSWKKFWRITLPLITPTIFFNLIIQLINGFLAFTQSYIITQGKPMDSTLFYTVYVYQQAFTFSRTGYASALAWIMLVIISIFTAILFATKKYWVYDEEG